MKEDKVREIVRDEIGRRERINAYKVALVRIVKFNGLTTTSYIAGLPVQQTIRINDIVQLQSRHGRTPVGVVVALEYRPRKPNWYILRKVGEVSSLPVRYPFRDEEVLRWLD